MTGSSIAPQREPHRIRLGVYTDTLYRCDDAGLSTTQAFLGFVSEFADHVGELVLFGRVQEQPARAVYPIDPRVRFVRLPGYPSIRAVVQQLRSLRGTASAFRAELPALDAIWVFGPHPMSFLLAVLARRHGVPLFLGVRQDYPVYIRHRLPGRGWIWAIPVAHVLERGFRFLARTSPTVTVGDALAERYSGGRAPVLSTGFSLIRRSEVVADADALARPLHEPFTVLTVGRIAQEKNPLLLAHVAAALARRGGAWRFVVVGDGPMENALRSRVEELGLADAFEFTGYVPSGPQLWSLYRSSDAFLHVSLTEGVPQVLWEAQAAGTPVVATDVGGVAAAVGDSALLIPPRDADAAADAVESLRHDRALRESVIRRGLCNARSQTIETHVERIARFFMQNRSMMTTNARPEKPQASVPPR